MNEKDKALVDLIRKKIADAEITAISPFVVKDFLDIIKHLEAENEKLKKRIKKDDDYKHRCADWQGES